MNTDKKKFRLSRLLPVLFLFLFIGAIVGLNALIKDKAKVLAEEKASATAIEQVPVNVVLLKIAPKRVEDILSLPGMALADEDLTLLAEVSGMIAEVQVREGDQVEKGALLVQLDRRDYQNTLDSIAAQKELAESNFSRMRQLLKQNAVSQNEFDRAEASLKELNAAFARAELDLERTAIRAPLDGVINALPAKKGLLLSRADPVAQLLVIDPIKIEVAVPEKDLPAARLIKECAVSIAALDDLQLVGRKIFLSSQPQSAAMAYTMWLRLPNSQHTLRPGMFADVKLVRQTVENGIVVPLYAVITGDEGKFVYVIEDEVAVKRPVSTGFLSGWSILIEKGIAAGDRVVIVGHRSLENGQKVNIVKEVTDSAEILP